MIHKEYLHISIIFGLEIKFIISLYQPAEKIAMRAGIRYNVIIYVFLNKNLLKEVNDRMELNKHIFLIGFMGCGKSTNARYLSQITGSEQMEMDQKIVEEQGMAITDIFQTYGETYFRDLETELIRKLNGKTPMVEAERYCVRRM